MLAIVISSYLGGSWIWLHSSSNLEDWM